MKKAKKVIALTLCAVMLVVGSVAGTMAYLNYTTEAVTNTFTVGNVVIDLDEAPVDNDGKETTGDRVKANAYKLMPGHEYDKDPTVHVGGTEDCYLFVKVTNAIATIEADANGIDTIAEQITENGWFPLTDDNTDGIADDGVYALNTVAHPGDDKVVFETFKIAGTVDNATIATYATSNDATKVIEVIAYAVQVDGFDTTANHETDVRAAWAAAPSTWTASSTTTNS